MNPTAQAPQPDASNLAPASDANAAKLPLLYVGSGDWGTKTGAITSYRFDATSGSLQQASRVEAGGLLSFLATDSKGRFVYAADEEDKLLRSFARDASGKLTPLATTATETGPVYVRVTQNDGFILAAQFNGGQTEVFPLAADGGFGPRSSVAKSGAESHSIYLSGDERFGFVPGRGSDRITQFSFDAASGKLTASGSTAEVKGAGCRHMAFDATFTHAYLVNEFANTVSVFTFEGKSGKLTRTQSLSSLPAGFTAKSSAADIHLHPSGRFAFVSNRPADGDGILAVFAVAQDGKLTWVESTSTFGRVPRNFTLNADGSRLLVGNQESKSIVTYSVDATNGHLSKLSETSVDVKPFFVSFLSSTQ